MKPGVALLIVWLFCIPCIFGAVYLQRANDKGYIKTSRANGYIVAALIAIFLVILTVCIVSRMIRG